MNFKHFYPEVFNPITQDWSDCPYPDLPLLQHQSLLLLKDYTPDGIIGLISELEAYIEEANTAMQEDSPEHAHIDDIRWTIFTGISDINPTKEKSKHHHYFAALTLIFLSKIAYDFNGNNSASLTNNITEAYRSREHALVHHFLEEGIDDYYDKYRQSFSGKFASEGGRKSTSILSQDKPAVLKEWEKVKIKNLSRNKSADLIIDNLKLKQQHSTILTWIREHESKINSSV